MKKIVLKSAFAIACVAAASVSGFKAYEQHNKNVAAANMLLAENVEALSSGDGLLDSLMGLLGYQPKEEKQYPYMTMGGCYKTITMNGKTQRVPGQQYVCRTCNTENTCILPIPNDCQ